jgi:hypothetical protein
LREEYTQASLLVFRPQVDLLDELRKNRALYIPEPHDPWPTLYNVSDSLRLNILRVKSRIEQHSAKRIGDHPVMNAAIMLGAQWLAQEKDIDPLLDIRRHFNGIDSNVDRLTASVIQSIFETFPIRFETAKRQSVHMPINIHRVVSSLSEDVGTTVNNVCTLAMMRTFSILPETIYESSQEMTQKINEFRKLCDLRYRAMKAILQEFDL